MKFSLVTVSAVIYAPLISAFPAVPSQDLICGDYSGMSFDMTEQCGRKNIIKELKHRFLETFKDKDGCKRKHFGRDLKILTSTSDVTEAQDVIKQKCKDAHGAAVSAASDNDMEASWQAIEAAGVDLEEYFNGDGFLNSETGNFHQDESDLRMEQNRFIYTGTDPRLNDHYPTTEQSYHAGLAVDSFLETAETAYLQDPLDFSGTCNHQAIMCCWHRDRQYADNNGNCKSQNCYNKEPGDNTDLCWTEDEVGIPTPYPGDDVEGNLHCHGFAWSNELDVNSYARWNNLFYVSMHDHMYTRGYVESLTNDPNIANVQPMCGCIEEMNPVSRSDCTEAIGVTDYTISVNGATLFIEAKPDTYRIEFQACEGYIFDQEIEQEDFEDALEFDQLEEKDNDLSAFVYRLYLEEKMTKDTMHEIFKTLVAGYENPNEDREVSACQAAYEAKFEGRSYEGDE